MHKRMNVPAKVLLISVLTVMSLLALSSFAWADTSTTPGGTDRFEIIEVSGRSAYFSIRDTGDCDDTDENCTIRVTRPADVALSTESDWATEFNTQCGNSIPSRGTGAQNKAFENCWNSRYEVEWPIIELGSDFKFDITPHCDGSDTECAIELAVCYNPEDCDPSDDSARDRDSASSVVGDLWDDAGRCLYDDDEEDVWECIDDEFQDWLDDEMGSRDDYDDLIDEMKRSKWDDLGIATDENRDYDDDLNDVGGDSGPSRDEDPETRIEFYQRRWQGATPIDLLRDEEEVDKGGYSFRPNQDEYLTIDVTSYFDLSGSVPIQNTVIGNFTLAGESSFFRQYLTNFYVQITDRKIVDCMDDRGYDVDDEHNVALNNLDLIACDERVAEAVKICPTENIGAQYIIYRMYHYGLLAGILSDAAAHTLRTNLEDARVRAPECLCAAGFEEKDMIISERASSNPWFSTTARRPANVCR